MSSPNKPKPVLFHYEEGKAYPFRIACFGNHTWAKRWLDQESEHDVAADPWPGSLHTVWQLTFTSPGHVMDVDGWGIVVDHEQIEPWGDEELSP